MKTYWHLACVDADDKPILGNGDGREIKVGETLTVKEQPILCKRGLHASEKALDALELCSGPVICRVTLGGTIIYDHDKAVATERTVIAMLDRNASERILREFARWCALQVIHLWDAPDVVKQYLETGDESLKDAARAASWAAAGAASWAAARGVAWAAAGAAANHAAWALDKGVGSAWDVQNQKLEEMIEDELQRKAHE